jgi:hypothetical protein
MIRLLVSTEVSGVEIALDDKEHSKKWVDEH